MRLKQDQDLSFFLSFFCCTDPIHPVETSNSTSSIMTYTLIAIVLFLLLLVVMVIVIMTVLLKRRKKDHYHIARYPLHCYSIHLTIKPHKYLHSICRQDSSLPQISQQAEAVVGGGGQVYRNAMYTEGVSSPHSLVATFEHDHYVTSASSTDHTYESITDIDLNNGDCLLYTSPSPRDATLSRMPSSA